MPISTTLLMTRSPSPSRPRQPPSSVVGVPELADDLGRGQIAVETLLAGGAEGAIERAAGLGRNAQRAAVLLGNEDASRRHCRRRHPAATCACRRPTVSSRSTARAAITACAAELRAQTLGHVGHRRRNRPRRSGASSAAPGGRETASRPDRRNQAVRPSASKSSRLTVMRLRSATGDRRSSPGRSRRFRPWPSPARRNRARRWRRCSRRNRRGWCPPSAFFGSVAPISSRFLAMAFSPSSTWIITGPEIMNSTRSLKKGRSLCTA